MNRTNTEIQLVIFVTTKHKLTVKKVPSESSGLKKEFCSVIYISALLRNT